MGNLYARSAFFLALLSGISFAGRGTVQPRFDVDPDDEEWGISGASCSNQQKSTLIADAARSCSRLRRAQYAMLNYDREIRAMYGMGLNMGVYLTNKSFYQDRIRRRLKACDTGSLSFKCVGSCGTKQETDAYVLVTLGFVHHTVNFCNEYFSLVPGARETTLAHEFGRLENIGDAGELETNNIYVWDAILENLSSDMTLQMLKAARNKK